MNELNIKNSTCGCCAESVQKQADDYGAYAKKYGVIIACILYVLTLCIDFGFFEVALPQWCITSIYVAVYFYLGYNILKEAALGLIRRDFFNENSLMALASLGAWGIGEGAEGVAILLFYRLGEVLESNIVERSKKSIRSLQSMKVDEVRLLQQESYVKVKPETINVDDIIVVFAGERIAVDGIVLKGESSLDVAALNGESLPLNVKEGDEVLSGSINIDGVLHIQAIKNYKDSTFNKIIELIEEGSAKKSRSEEFISRFARYYTPTVTVLALLIAFIPPLYLGIVESNGFVDSFKEWFSRGLIFLVVSCPCALVVSIPLSFFVSLGRASQEGILIKGSSYLESLYYAKSIVFDKTGTLTKGELYITKVNVKHGWTKEQILGIAKKIEQNSNHPIAQAIVNDKSDYEECDVEFEQISEQAGGGIHALSTDGIEILVGNKHFIGAMKCEIDTQGSDSECQILVSYNNEVIGVIFLEDSIKEEANQALHALKQVGIKAMYLLSGDKNSVVQSIAKTLGIGHYQGELLPAHKVSALEHILGKKENRHTIFVGDGINDAPSLALSDVGIAMGKRGSDVALEGADIVIMNDQLTKIPLAIAIAQKTRRILWQNIIFALGTKGAIMVFGALGVANMWIALFGDVGVALIAFLNAMRGLR